MGKENSQFVHHENLLTEFSLIDSLSNNSTYLLENSVLIRKSKNKVSFKTIITSSTQD